MMEEVVITALFSVGFNVVMFIPAFIMRTDKLTDISYALTFLAVGIFGFLRSERPFGHALLLTVIILWSVRLGGFLYMRILRMKTDRRFDGMRDKFFKFLGFWILQGLTVPMVLVASVIYFGVGNPTVSVSSLVGLLILLCGLCIEAIADQQKFRFSGDLANKDKWIESGIWSISRHPNYLGEIMVWFGVYLFVASSLEGIHLLVGAFSPIYIAGLLIFVSGIPLLEKSADQKWGSDKKYQEYKKRTPVLIPFLKTK